MPRPVRQLLIIVAIFLVGFIFYSWLQGYQRFGRDPLTGQLLQVKVRPGPSEAIRNFGTLFPEFLRGVLPLVMIALFYMSIIIIQFVGMFWFLSKGQSYTIYPGEYDVGFDDVRGQPAIVDATKEVVKLFEGFKEFRKMGGYPPHGILFEGPPGTGKTLLGKAIAGQTNVPFLYSNGTSFTSMFMGIGNLKIKAMFKKARRYSKEYDGAVIFIDELDAVAGSRGAVSAASTPYEDVVVPQETRDFWSVNRFIMGGLGGGMNSMLVNELLTQMDGLVLPRRRFRHIARLLKRKPKIPNYNILIIGATNRASVLDPALLRPGRFDRKIHVGNPTAEGRKDIIQYYLDKVKHVPIDLDKLSNSTVGYSPARIKNIINEGLIFALQAGRDAVSYDDIWQAMLTDEIGLKQPVVYTPWEKESTSIHEAGHAVARWFLDPSKAITIITIQKREDALGMVVSMELEERFSRTRDEYLADIKVSLGGMVAEHLWYGQTTSGPSSDLQAATMRAAQMVGYLGMGTGLLSYGAIPPSADGSDRGLSSVLSDKGVREEVERILAECRDDVTDLLRRKAHCVEAIRDRLMIEEQLTGEQFAQLMHTLGEDRNSAGVITLRRPPRTLGQLRPLGPGEGAVPTTNGENGSSASHNGDSPVAEGPATNGDAAPRPNQSPWARPPHDIEG